MRQALSRLFNIRLIAMGMALLTAMPMVIILTSFMHPEPDIWEHIIDTLLKELLTNTLVLSAGVVTITAVLGTGTAWFTSVCDFPGRRFFSWALLLPLAIPTYVFAFVFIGLLDFSGPVQSLFRTVLPHSRLFFPDIRSTMGVIVVLSLALYPYVYLLARNAFKTQGIRALEAASILGLSPTQAFFKVALPMARPWIVGGLMLVLMETLSDFGAVSIFNFDTLTTAIYKAWFGFFSLNAAAQLSSILLVIISLVILTEQHMRTRIRYHQVGRMTHGTSRILLAGWKKWVVCILLFILFVIGFLVPFAQLMFWSLEALPDTFPAGLFGLLARSMFFALATAVTVCFAALILAYIQRHHKDKLSSGLIRLSTMGYALPGTVLAVGIVIMVTAVDSPLATLVNRLSGTTLTALFQGTVVMVILGCTIRFMALGFNTISSALERISTNVDEASAILGVTGMKRLGRIHVPVLKNGLLTAAILVFVDVMKEMPITLMTRPFGWDTLAVKIFELTSEGEWQRAALPSMVLVMAGLLPLVLLTKKSD